MYNKTAQKVAYVPAKTLMTMSSLCSKCCLQLSRRYAAATIPTDCIYKYVMLYVYVYVYMYICICENIYTYIHTCIAAQN